MSARRAILVAIGVIALAIGLSALAHRIGDQRGQDALDSFYATPTDVANLHPGDVIRTETLPNAELPGASAYRILYRTARPDGAPAVSGAIVLVPTAPAPPGGRPVLAYAHGTLGQGRGCAPSRRRDPISLNAAWFEQAIAAGFVIVATDYAGIGTQGPNLYLVGRAEALDIANSVRALDDVAGAEPGVRWTVYGHSQGGHAALWTADLVHEVLPEKQLIGVAAAAPAADLPAIVADQWNTGIGWGVGAEVARSWPSAYPGIDFGTTLTWAGRRWTDAVADACLGEGVPAPAILGFVAAGLGVPYFDRNPTDDPAVARVAAAETPRPLPATMPLIIAQGTADTIVPPRTNASLQRAWCAHGSDLTMLWLGGVGHVDAAVVAGPTVVPWLRALFDGVHPEQQCDGVPPVPASSSQVMELGGLVN